MNNVLNNAGNPLMNVLFVGVDSRRLKKAKCLHCMRHSLSANNGFFLCGNQACLSKGSPMRRAVGIFDRPVSCTDITNTQPRHRPRHRHTHTHLLGQPQRTPTQLSDMCHAATAHTPHRLQSHTDTTRQMHTYTNTLMIPYTACRATHLLNPNSSLGKAIHTSCIHSQ